MERTPLDGSWDVVICGASFAGLAVARELRAGAARVLVLDRYEIGERQTSACAAPTQWLVNLGLDGAIQQTFSSLLVHAPRGRSFRWALPWTFSTFDYRTLCSLLAAQGDFTFETAKVSGRSDFASGTAPGDVTPGDVTIHTDRGDVSAPLVVDALGWRRVLGAGANVQPPRARLSRGLEIHPDGNGRDLELWLDPKYVRSGYGWSFPADAEVRVGVGSFEPRDHVKEPTLALAREVEVPAVRFQGNWIPHQIRAATDDRMFFVGDSAGHCLPTTAEGIRTALYFGIACGRELRAVLDGERTREEALRRYCTFSREHAWKFGALLKVQNAVGRLNPTPLMPLVLRALTSRRLAHWAFEHYLAIAPPSFALAGEPFPSSQARAAAAAA
ncbi:MAG: NAD(P)/FAD-dependent oxidoreductase [Actinomycetota bacterium]|nr:NAD(P)/FAD-dependent oxidoreductase [Solirubrobacterales bacterium]MDQ3371397.1 NAD(P)/FAD-dependent oxidoreductase [Actinomycetota bacterium]